MDDTNNNTPSAADSWPDLEITVTKKNGVPTNDPKIKRVSDFLKSLRES